MNPEQLKALPELEKNLGRIAYEAYLLRSQPHDDRWAWDDLHECEQAKFKDAAWAAYGIGKASAVSVNVEEMLSDLVQYCEGICSVGIEEQDVEDIKKIILRHLTDESEEVRRLRELLGAGKTLVWHKPEDGNHWRAGESNGPGLAFSIYKDGDDCVVFVWLNRYKIFVDHGISYDNLDQAQESCEALWNHTQAVAAAACAEIEAQGERDIDHLNSTWSKNYKELGDLLDFKDSEISALHTSQKELAEALKLARAYVYPVVHPDAHQLVEDIDEALHKYEKQK